MNSYKRNIIAAIDEYQYRQYTRYIANFKLQLAKMKNYVIFFCKKNNMQEKNLQGYICMAENWLHVTDEIMSDLFLLSPQVL